MKKLFEKNKLTFALILIATYCLLQSVANPINDVIGTEYSASAFFCVLQAVILFVFVKKNNLMSEYGLCPPTLSGRRLLYYLPLVFIATRNLWGGFSQNLPLADTACYLLCMLCVGFVEELIFRGFLYRAMAENSEKSAIVTSSITFGVGHILNLFNGSGMTLFENLLQIVSAVTMGFLFVTVFRKCKSLVPCILTHSAINMTSAFANETAMVFSCRLIFQVILLSVTIFYTLYLSQRTSKGGK